MMVMRLLGRCVLRVVIGALVLAAGAASGTRADMTPIRLLDPAQGQVFRTGAQVAFHIRTHPGDGHLWLHVSRSPATGDACGTIKGEVEVEPFAPTADSSVYEAKPALFDYSGFWMNTPGTYYWQAYGIEYRGGADGCIESGVRTFTIRAAATSSPPPTAPEPAAPKPAAPEPAAPKTGPTPKSLALSKARLAGRFEVVERFTSVSGIDVKVGSKDTGTWRFVPLCSAGVCNVRLTFRYGHASDVLSAPHTQKVPLTRRGASYSGVAKNSLLECGIGNEVVGKLTVKLGVTKGAWINGRWRGTRFKGTVRLEAPEAVSGIWRCQAARYTAALSGSLES